MLCPLERPRERTNVLCPRERLLRERRERKLLCPRERRELKVLCPREREALEAKEQRNKGTSDRENADSTVAFRQHAVKVRWAGRNAALFRCFLLTTGFTAAAKISALTD